MKIDEAKDILEQLDLPRQQTNEMCSRVLLALANITEGVSWSKSKDNLMRVHDIIEYISKYQGVRYAENSRETIRKQALKPFINAAIVETNGKSTNSPNFAYRLTTEFLELIKKYNTFLWEEELEIFLDNHQSLADLYKQRRKIKMIDITINGEKASLSLGVHNRLQKQILDQFASRFAQKSTVLYIGDTQNKFLYKDEETLKKLGINIFENDKLPDVVLYQEENDWVYFIEAVTHVGPMTPQRILEIKELCKDSKSGFIYVTAFLHFNTYKRFSNSLAWDTEVWIAEMPDHMIHLNGDKFFGPRK